MGLGGYNDRDRNINNSMYECLNSSWGMSYLRREKLKDVTPKRAPKISEKDTIIRTYCPESVLPENAIVRFQKEILELVVLYRNIPECALFTKNLWELYTENIDKARRQYKNIIQLLTKIFDVEVIYYEEDFMRLCRIAVFQDELSKKKLCLIFKNLLLCKVDAIKKITIAHRNFMNAYKNKKIEAAKLRADLKFKEEVILKFDKIPKDDIAAEIVDGLRNLHLEQKARIEADIEVVERYLAENEENYREIEWLLRCEKI